MVLLTLLKDWKRHHKVARWCFLCLILLGTVVNCLSTRSSQRAASAAQDRATADHEQVVALRQAVKSEQETNQKNSGRFQQSFEHLHEKFSELQTKIKTEELQKELRNTKVELRATQKALAPPPKAELAFSFVPLKNRADNPVRTIVVPAVDNVITFDLYIYNMSPVSALKVEVWFRICQDCKFAHELEGFRKLPGAPEYERNRMFEWVYPDMGVPTVTAKVQVPPIVEDMEVGFKYMCETCTTRTNWQVGKISTGRQSSVERR